MKKRYKNKVSVYNAKNTENQAYRVRDLLACGSRYWQHWGFFLFHSVIQTIFPPKETNSLSDCILHLIQKCQWNSEHRMAISDVCITFYNILYISLYTCFDIQLGGSVFETSLGIFTYYVVLKYTGYGSGE